MGYVHLKYFNYLLGLVLGLNPEKDTDPDPDPDPDQDRHQNVADPLNNYTLF